jgi:hypothetical protein
LVFPYIGRKKEKATLANGNIVKINYKRDKPSIDYRLRLSLTAHYKKWEISTGYSFGLRNYEEEYVVRILLTRIIHQEIWL